MMKIKNFFLFKKRPTKENLDIFLKNADENILKKHGFREFNGVYLFPYNWYNIIPENYEIIYASHLTIKFNKDIVGSYNYNGNLGFGIIYNHNHIQSDQNTN